MPTITPKPTKEPTKFRTSSGIIRRAQRVLIYGPGGVGKTTLAANSPRPRILDIDGGSANIDVARIDGINDWNELRAALQDPNLWAEYDTIVLDSTTKAEEYVVTWAINNIPHEKGHKIQRIEDYGFGKGYQHVFDTFLLILADLDRLVEQGKNVVLIAHECVNDAPNPEGEDFLRYEPRLQSPKSGKASIRDRVFEWCDWVGYLGYDVLSKDGKGRGNGTRTLYFESRPTWRAKGRSSPERPVEKVIPWNDPKSKEPWSCLS